MVPCHRKADFTTSKRSFLFQAMRFEYPVETMQGPVNGSAKIGDAAKKGYASEPHPCARERASCNQFSFKQDFLSIVVEHLGGHT